MKGNKINSDNPLPGRSSGSLCALNQKKPHKEKCYGKERIAGAFRAP